MTKVEILAKRIKDSFDNNVNYNCAFHPLKSHPNFIYLPDIIKEFYIKIGTGSLGSSFLYFDINEPNFFDLENDQLIPYFTPDYEFFNTELNSKLVDVIFIGHDVDARWFGYDVKLNKFIVQWETDDKDDIVDLLNMYIENHPLF
jgi:hypothetical protein